MDMETARVITFRKTLATVYTFAQLLDQSKYEVINKDQWWNILEFSRTINHNLSNYDFDGACKYIYIREIYPDSNKNGAYYPTCMMVLYIIIWFF